jgi:hypothetical protein
MSYAVIDTKREHERYEELDVNKRIAIDIAFKAAVKALRGNGIKDLAYDDRAEELVAAIAYYVYHSAF